ncbi:hypothetical protein JCM17823_13720 [Halorubrum gandharaense]
MRYTTAFGALAVLAGFILLLDAGLAAAVDLSAVTVTLVGALAAVQGIRYAAARRGIEPNTLTVGTPERRITSPVPGDDADTQLARSTAGGRSHYELRGRLRGRVRAVAVAEVAGARNCSPSRAADLVDRGAWTDDPVAAAFLADDLSYPARVRFRARLFGESLFERGFGAATAAVGRLATGDPKQAEPTSDGDRNGGGEVTA